MSINAMILHAARRSGVRLQSADVEDIASDVQLESIVAPGPLPRLVARVWARYRRALRHRPLALRIDIAGAMVPRDAVRWARQQRVRASKRRSNTAEVKEIEG